MRKDQKMIGESGMLAKTRRKAFAGPVIAERDERFEFVPSWALVKALQIGNPEQKPTTKVVKSERTHPLRDMLTSMRAKWEGRRKLKLVPADSSVRIPPEPPKLPVD